jgi:hypothetical protein
MVKRIVRSAGARAGEADPDELTSLIAIEADFQNAITEAVRGLRDSGCTWDDIGRAVGTTRQAAQMRWGPRLAAAEPVLMSRPPLQAEGDGAGAAVS